MLGTMEKIVLFAVGSFNPVTIMHLRMFELAKDHFRRTGSATVIGGIMSPVNDGYPKQGLAPAPHRLEMTRLGALSSHKQWVKVSPWETLETQGWTRTCDSLMYHQNKLDSYFNGSLPSKPAWIPDCVEIDSDTRAESAIKLKLLCGADVLESFNIPDLWSDQHMEIIARDFGMVVISRSGDDPECSIKKNPFLNAHKKNIILVEEKFQNEISSTKVRDAVRNGDSIRYFVPGPVVDYIEEHGLYGK